MIRSHVAALRSARSRAALSLGVVLAVGATGTFAAWTDSANLTGTTFTSGTLDVRDNAQLVCLTFGGIAQFLAGMWAYKARDIVATLAHGMWGAFWIAFFVLQLLQANGTVPTAAPHQPDLVFGITPIQAACLVGAGVAAAKLSRAAPARIGETAATGR